MECISSDTNIWIDFYVIRRLKWPFKLPYKYIMYQETISSELISYWDLKKPLLDYGLISTTLLEDEFWLASKLSDNYPGLSRYDSIALAIAKNRNLPLLTGDKALRNAASKENVRVVGTLWLLDNLLNNNLITKDDYLMACIKLRDNNGKKVRLPDTELLKRIKKINDTNGGGSL